MLKYQSTAIKMMDRLETHERKISEDERISHFNKLASYWDHVLNVTAPRLAFFPITPHACYDFIAYGLCQEKSIPTIICQRTGLPSRVLFLNSYEQSTLSLPVVKLDSEKGTPSFLNGDLRLHLKDLRTSNTLSALPLNMQSRLTSMG